MKITSSLSGKKRHADTAERFAVAGLGQCSLDYLCIVDSFPECDSKCEFNEFKIQGGGPVATALVVLARWGIQARFAGVVCRDSFGISILEELGREAIDCSATVIRNGQKSQFAFICVEKNTGKRTIFWGRPDTSPFDPHEVPGDFLENVNALHLDGLFMEASLHLARLAQSKKIPVILDAGSFRPGMIELIHQTDHLIASETFARQFAPQTSLPDLLMELKKMGPELVAITLGEKGSISVWEEGPYLLPALDIEPKDTTGAGDVFHGAYIYALLKGCSAPDRIRWATVAASLSCQSLGGRAGIPSLEGMEEKFPETGDFQNPNT